MAMFLCESADATIFSVRFAKAEWVWAANFLLDTTLGLINIEQNRIIKIFSVAAVELLPPTLVASVYGMNFEVMPELKWLFGNPFALAVMAASAIVPYLLFKKKVWL